jgi:hypothetical protein
MKPIFLLLAIDCVFTTAGQPPVPAEKPRLVILTDIGGDPDDEQSMIRLMLYSNEFDIEGLIASSAGTTGELKDEVVKPELIREIVEAYGKVRDNLMRHDPAFPPARQLLDRIKFGNPHRGVRSLGDEHDTEGSSRLIELVDQPDPRPLNIAIWGGSTELAQALWRVKHDRGPDGLARFVAKLHVYAINHQDDTGPWIIENFPDLFYILSRQPEGRDKRESAYRGMYLGGDESLTSRDWVDSHVRVNHGPLGALYPTRTWTEPNPHSTLKEGDTPSWFYFLPNGLNDPSNPEWGGWGGRFRHERGGLYRDATDTVGNVSDARTTVWRWRPAFQADFQARMDWCVQSPEHANHAPLAGWRGNTSRAIAQLAANPGDRVQLDATGSRDPDGHSLRYHWWIYRETGSYRGDVSLGHADSPNGTLLVPSDAAGTTIHVVLEVTDSGQPTLAGYRRVVLSVTN